MVIHHDGVLRRTLAPVNAALRHVHAQRTHCCGVLRGEIAQRVHAADGLQFFKHPSAKLTAAAQRGLVVVAAVEKALVVIEL